MHFIFFSLTDMNSEIYNMYTILAFLSAIGFEENNCAFKSHKDHIFAIFSYFVNCQK